MVDLAEYLDKREKMFSFKVHNMCSESSLVVSAPPLQIATPLVTANTQNINESDISKPNIVLMPHGKHLPLLQLPS